MYMLTEYCEKYTEQVKMVYKWVKRILRTCGLMRVETITSKLGPLVLQSDDSEGVDPAEDIDYPLMAKLVVYCVKHNHWDCAPAYPNQLYLVGCSQEEKQRRAIAEYGSNEEMVLQPSLFCGSKMGIPSDLMVDAFCKALATDYGEISPYGRKITPLSQQVNDLMLLYRLSTF
jgi:hypothetical protein